MNKRRNRSQGGRGPVHLSASGCPLARKMMAENMDLSPSLPPWERLHKRLAITVVLLAVWIGTAGRGPGFAAESAPEAAGKDTEELLKQYKRLRSERYDRYAAVLYDRVLRFAQADPATLSPADLFVRAFYEGDWNEVRETLERLPDDFASEVYNKMLGDLAGRNVPVLTLDDFLGLADACPGELDNDRIRKLGLLLRAAVAAEQEIWLKQALQRGTRHLGSKGPKRALTGRILMHAGFDELARAYLPSVADATAIEDAAVRDEILGFLASQDELEQFEQTRISRLWEQDARLLTDAGEDQGKRLQAADRLAELLGKAPAESFEPWIRALGQRNPDAVLTLAVAMGKRAHGRLNDGNLATRANNLMAQKTLLACSGEQADLAKPPWDAVAVAMAGWWISEAEHTFQYHPGYRKTPRSMPHVVPGELLASAPEGRWAETLLASLRERVDVCLSKAVLVSDQYQEAAELIVGLAGRNPKAAVALAEEYLKAWAYRHDPQVPEAVRRKYRLADDARITVTPIMMEKNIAGLAEMMDLFRKKGIPPQNGELLVGAFDVCYSKAEVYRRTHIERIFGPIDRMDEDVFFHMIRMMTQGLSSRWRTMEVQLESGTRRSQKETLEMVREGYQAAIDMIDQRCRTRSHDWKALTLAGSLLSDWGDFEYYQQLAGGANTDRMAAFREKNNQAQAFFSSAADAYAKQVGTLRQTQFSIDVYLAWFHSLLGINTDGRLNLAKPLDRRALSGLRDAIRGLPEKAGRAHVDLFARHVQARLDDKDNPLHEELKYKYLAGSLVVTKESPFAFQAGDKVAYYDELLGETRLATRVDGPNTIQRDHEFGIVFSVHHTEALGRMADFGKYLVNELPPANSPARRSLEQSLVPTYRMGDLQGRRDELEMNIREALGLFFDIRAIVFSPKEVQPRPADQPGWEETVLAYIQVKPKDASVDKIPSIQMSLEFLDLTGPVKITTESPETIIKVTDHPTSPRPYDRVDITETLDPRSLATTEEILLEIKATACGLVPELEDLVHLDSLREQLPIARIDPHEGTMLREVNSWGDTVHAVSERRWTVALDASGLLDPPRRTELNLPKPKIEAAVAYHAYKEMDLVDLDEPVTAVGEGETMVATAESLAPNDRRLWYAAGGGAALLLLLLLVVMYRARSPREGPRRAADVFRMPREIDGFVVVRLLRAMSGSELVRMSPAERSDVERDIQRIEISCFGENGRGALSEEELRGVARKWLRLAR